MYGVVEPVREFVWRNETLHLGEEEIVAERATRRGKDHLVVGVARYEDVEDARVGRGPRPTVEIVLRDGRPGWRLQGAPRMEAEWAARLIRQRVEAARRASQPPFGEALSWQELESHAVRLADDPVAVVDFLILQAIHHRATDVHLEPYVDELLVRFRVDGILRDATRLPIAAYPPLLTRLKVVAQLPLERAVAGQESRLRVRCGQRSVDLRVSCLPTLHGEKTTIRLFDPTARVLELADLGMDPATYETFVEAITQPQGAILMTGPSNSGKTTTMYSALLHLRRQLRHLSSIVTVEDPVEHDLRVINQTQVNPQRGLTFAKALRTVLRQDPEVIMVGEIRDKETAEIVVQAALTGHLIFSTVHARSAPAVFVRLVEMGLEPFTVASALTGVMAQRLVRQLCRDCCEERTLSEAELADLAPQGIEPPSRHFVPVGCERCEGSGYRGRTGLFAWLPVTAPLREAVLRRATIDEMEAVAADTGAPSLLTAGLRQVALGVTSIEELRRVLPRREAREENDRAG
jgi:Type II secretory pathway, ATPase PulE/Tfp pilus assembly pathway, ATPase PilB